MVKMKELSEDLRSCIVTTYNEGEGYKAISNHFKGKMRHFHKGMDNFEPNCTSGAFCTEPVVQ